MNKQSAIQLVVLLTLVLGTGYLLRDKLPLVTATFGRFGLTNKLEALTQKPEPTPQPTVDAQGRPIAINPPGPQEVAASDIAPLSPRTKPLTAVPARPTHRAPVLFMAPFHGPDNKEAPSANLFENMFRTYIRATPRERLMVNLLPQANLYEVYRREDGNFSIRGKGRESYLAAAKSLGAEVVVLSTVSEAGSTPAVQMEMIDTRTSRTQTWSSSATSPAPKNIADVLSASTRSVANFCGISEADYKRSGMQNGLPANVTWETLLNAKDQDDYLMASVLQADPDCLYLYEYASPSDAPLRYIDRILKKHPDDIRLLRAKARFLTNMERKYPAYLIYAELVRRYPDCLLIVEDLEGIISQIYPHSSDAINAPEDWKAVIALLRQQTGRFPNNYMQHWLLASCCDKLSWYVRGGKTASHIPENIWRYRDELNREATESIQKAVELQPNSSSLMRAMLYIFKTAGYTDPDWQKGIIERIHAVDPSNTHAEMYAANSHSIGWGDPEVFLEFVDTAIKNHQGDARSMNIIGYTIGTELTRLLNWKAMTPEQVYKEPNPLSDRYLQCVEFAMNNDVQVDKWMAGMFREMYRQRYGDQKVTELLESGKHWALTAGAAQDAHDKGDWEKSLKLARLAEEKSRPYLKDGMVQYYVVKSLWKLGRHDEALSEARNGIARYPDQQTFYYMFAVVANEKGSPMEEAYERAYRAVDLSTTNTSANSTFEAIRKKLNKPAHPKLKSQG